MGGWSDPDAGRRPAEGNQSERAANRRSGLGALFGYGVGLGVGAAYGLLQSVLPVPRRPWVAATGLGLAAMAASDYEALAGRAG